MHTTIAERKRGSLLGLAWGDVLGCPVEYWGKSLIAQVYGCYEGLPAAYPLDAIPKEDFIWGHLRPLGLHSDDTQQALTLLQACLHPDGFRIERWAEYLLLGQHERAWRGTGRNFRGALANLSRGIPPLQSGMPTAGIGGAMRIAPLGAIYCADRARLEQVVFESTYMTHADVRAVSLALAVATGCALRISGVSDETIRGDLPTLVERFETSLGHNAAVRIAQPSHLHAVSNELRRALTQDWTGLDAFRDWLSRRAHQHLEDRQDIELIPNHPMVMVGGIHALVVGLWPGSTPGGLLANVIQQGGDSDTVGAIVGALLGAKYGIDWIPSERMTDSTALHAYADGMVRGVLPEGAIELIAREAKLTAVEHQFTKQLIAQRGSS